MNSDTKYVIQNDVKFGAMEKIDITALEKACPHDWFNQTLFRVNDSLVHLGIFKGAFHWHSGNWGHPFALSPSCGTARKKMKNDLFFPAYIKQQWKKNQGKQGYHFTDNLADEKCKYGMLKHEAFFHSLIII